MKRNTAILCAALLAAVSVAAFVFIFPAGGPALPGTSILDDAPKPAHTQPDTMEKIEPKEEEAARGTHPMDTMIASMTREEQVAQLFWVRCPDEGAAELVQTYQPAGYVLFGRDFENKSREEVAQTVQSYQAAAKIPLLIGTDEEGGTVVRASANRALRRWPFESPQRVYERGGLHEVEADTAEKDRFLQGLGVNVNLAPVADVSTDAKDFIYPRTMGKGAQETADYVGVVVRTMKNDGMGTVLKHFPGYGSNGDTHAGAVTDTRPAERFHEADFLPFRAGIRQGADAVLVSHTIVQVFDAAHPASLSPNIHQILREELGFQGVIVTDDLAMEALALPEGEAAVQAVQAGNDLLLSSNFAVQYQAVLDAVNQGQISENTLYDALRRVLQWKSDLGLLQAEGA